VVKAKGKGGRRYEGEGMKRKENHERKVWDRGGHLVHGVSLGYGKV